MTGPDLRQRLADLDLTQAELARLMDIRPHIVSRWCADFYRPPRWLPSWLAMYEMLTPEQRETLKKSLATR